jgi:hypothetical protein
MAADHLEAHETEYVHFVDDSLGSFKECDSLVLFL